MSHLVRVVPDTDEFREAFGQLTLSNNNERPIAPMNDMTTSDINIIWSSIENTASYWRGNKNSRIPGMPVDRKEFWGAFALEPTISSLPMVEKFIEKNLALENVQSILAVAIVLS